MLIMIAQHKDTFGELVYSVQKKIEDFLQPPSKVFQRIITQIFENNNKVVWHLVKYRCYV